MDDFINEHYIEYLQAKPAAVPTVKCCVCLEDKKEFFKLENCGHEICVQCNSEYLHSKIREGCRRLEDFACPHQDKCACLYTEEELERVLDFEYFAKLTNRAVFELDIVCPNTDCRNRCSFKSDEAYFTCFSCYTEICKFCKGFEHGDRCNTESNYFKEVLAAIDGLQEEDTIGYCPKCLNPFLKDENCDHVTCQNEECNTEFCFYCSAIFHGINWHGNHYHRADCRNFEHYDCEDYYTGDCPGCYSNYCETNNETVCKRPDTLRDEFLKKIKEEKLGKVVEVIQTAIVTPVAPEPTVPAAETNQVMTAS